jgi:trimeric autotransporter adhesin
VGRCARLFVLCLGIACLIGCGSSSSGTANLRIFQASPDAPHVNILIDGASTAPNIVYGNNTGYLSLKSGSHHVQAVPVNASTPIFDQSISVASSSNQTLLLTGAAASIKPVTLTDGGTTTTTGDGHVRVLNASSTMGPADVYIVPAGSSIAGVQPTSAALALDKDTGYKLIAAGSFQVFLTAPGTTNAYVSTGPINLTSGQNQTVVALDGVSGGFTYALLVDQ